MSGIYCSINTPKSSLKSLEGDMIVLPGEQGEIGVLEKHMNLVAELSSGKIKIYKDGEIIQELEVKDSIAYIKGDSIEVFSD